MFSSILVSFGWEGFTANHRLLFCLNRIIPAKNMIHFRIFQISMEPSKSAVLCQLLRDEFLTCWRWAELSPTHRCPLNYIIIVHLSNEKKSWLFPVHRGWHLPSYLGIISFFVVVNNGSCIWIFPHQLGGRYVSMFFRVLPCMVVFKVGPYQL